MGTNADLVLLARLDGYARGDVYRHVYRDRHGGTAFEHFAKERCLLPASAFPAYRARAVETPWWRLHERQKRLPIGVVDAVLEEVEAHGPLTAAELGDHGAVAPIDWSGWKGTSKASSMALEVLWTQCRVVVCGRREGRKLYDVPARVFVDEPPPDDLRRWAVLRRVEAAGLLARAGGPCWSMLRAARTSPLVDALVAEGALEEVRVEGSARPYLAPAGFLERGAPDDDGALRILGPLDPLLWDRKLVWQAFDFEYVWEVYKPQAKRRWGWYVMPLLHEGALVGRLEGRVDGDTLVVENVWKERALDLRALDAALEKHALACGCDWYVRPTRV